MVNGLFEKSRSAGRNPQFRLLPGCFASGTKFLCRYPQYYATKKLFESVLAHRKPEGDGKGGTYFGATGCGKSFTMLFLSRLLMRSVELASPTIVLITDRTDWMINYQACSPMVKYLGDESVISVESRAHLRELLKDRNSGVFSLLRS